MCKISKVGSVSKGQFILTQIICMNYLYECLCSDFHLYIHSDANANIHRKHLYK